jgi:hypothetical protein
LHTETVFHPSGLASCLHAAQAVADGQVLADGRLAAALELPARQLAGEITAAGLPAGPFWRHLLPLSARIGNRRELAETALVKVQGRHTKLASAASAIAAAIAGVENAFRSSVPNLTEELTLRERPIRDQWEARGPGLLKQIGVLTDECLLPERCEVILIEPVLGGYGAPFLSYNQIHLEAVLANSVAELPEVVRLAWLIAQLQLDLPVYSEHVHPDRLPHIARFAMLPVTLAAAEYVELARLSPETVARAIEAWRLTVPPDVDGPATVLHWWQTYLETRPPWPVAMAALDQMFG